MPQNSDFLDPLLSPTIQDDGTPKIRRANINYIGATIVDNPTTDSTDITLPGGGGGGQLSEADNAALRAVSVLVDGQVAVVKSPPNQFIYSASLGAGQADDGATIIKPSSVSGGSNGRWYSLNGQILPTIAALRLAVSGIQSSIQVQTFATAGDGGGDVFDKVSGTVTDDGGFLIQPSGASFHYVRRANRHNKHIAQYGAASDGTISDSTSIASLLSSLGDTTKLRSGAVKFPNSVTAISSLIACTAKGGTIEGCGSAPVSAGGSCVKWTGSSGGSIFRVRQSAALAIRDVHLTCLTPDSRPTTAIDLNVQPAEPFSNTNIAIENVTIGAIAGDTIPAGLQTVQTTGNTSPTVTVSNPLLGLAFTVSTGGARGTAKVKIATSGYSLDPTSTTWIDAGGAHVDFASAHEFPTAATVAIPGTSAVLNMTTGTYVVGDYYRYDNYAFDNGVTLSGTNSQNDQSTFRRVAVQGVKEVGLDFQNSQSTTCIVDETKFNDLKIGVQTKSRIMNVRGCFFSTIYEACVRQLTDGGVRVTDCGAEGCARFVYADAGLVEIESCYFQPNARFMPADGQGADAFIWQNGLDDTNSNINMRVAKCNFTSDGSLGARVAKIKLSGCRSAMLVLDTVGFEADATITDYLAHVDMATIQSGQTRFLEFNYKGVRYTKYWEHGDHANEVAFNGYMFGPVDVNIRRGQRLITYTSAGNVAELVQYHASGGYAQLGGFTTPCLTSDLNAITSGVDFNGYRNWVAQPSLDISLIASTGKSVVLKNESSEAVVSTQLNDFFWHKAFASFKADVLFPTIAHLPATGANNGTQLTFQAQNGGPTGDTNGADFVLAGGEGHDAGTNGTVVLQIGGATGLQVDAMSDGETALLVRRNVGGSFTLQRVSMGVADSGGSGFKVLRVPN